jgi:hypothetical protein
MTVGIGTPPPYQLKHFNGTGWCMQVNTGGLKPPPYSMETHEALASASCNG